MIRIKQLRTKMLLFLLFLTVWIILLFAFQNKTPTSSVTSSGDTEPETLPPADASLLLLPSTVSSNLSYDISMPEIEGAGDIIPYPIDSASFFYHKDTLAVFTRSLSLSENSFCDYGLFRKNGNDFSFFFAQINTPTDAERLCHLLRCYVDYYPTILVGRFDPETVVLLKNVCHLEDMSANGYQVLTSSIRAESYEESGILLLNFLPTGKTLDLDKKMVALTYDDGPSANTSTILNVLSDFNAKATFFVTGTHVTDYPNLLQRAFNEGHEIGNHTNLHEIFSENTPSIIRKTIEETNQKIRDTIGIGAYVVRPPGGEINDRYGRFVELNYPIILWNLDTLDYEATSSDEIIESITTTLTDGSIVLMHDTHRVTEEAAATIMLFLQENGYQALTVSELLEFGGNGIENGTVYLSAQGS